jgi:hypothetical protein
LYGINEITHKFFSEHFMGECTTTWTMNYEGIQDREVY